MSAARQRKLQRRVAQIMHAVPGTLNDGRGDVYVLKDKVVCFHPRLKRTHAMIRRSQHVVTL